MERFKILYAEDDDTIALLTKDALEEKYLVTHCKNGQEALLSFTNNNFDLCIFDIMMPKMDGFSLAESIRKVNNDIPIIFLSAKTHKDDRIKGLKTGADDYLIKPFSIEELELKIQVFIRRSLKTTIHEDQIYTLENLIFDAKNYTVTDQNTKTILTQREAELLQLFLDNKDEVLKRELILTKLWGSDDYFLGRSLDVFISRLRKILSSQDNITIENLHGIGFRLKSRK
ncbi:response regulator transcription factor [Flavobacterium sp. H122]|uniref:response regulator transcription factor n=1 Tax=Flavobacterium sp. H122 TaxID=2529860 RepID=UPI0010A9C142|nr:response regulator transcription factor [Flavobacterium sp. H122]